MDACLDEVELSLIVNIETLREVLKKLNVNSRLWWIASDPADALDSGFVTIGHGDPGCVDRLNTVYYKLPVLNGEKPFGGFDKLVLLLDSSVIVAEQAGLYWEDGRVFEDQFADLECFFLPIKRALAGMMNEA